MLILSKVGNFALDLPDAELMVQVSGTFGSRQEEAQRLGRLLRPKTDGRQSHFYSLVTAIRHAGPKPTKEKVLAALESLGRYDLGDYVLNYSPVLHKAEPSVDITIIGSQGRLIK